jgi:hypothetical protein
MDINSISKEHDFDKGSHRDHRIWMSRDISRLHVRPIKALERQQYWQDGNIISRQPICTVSPQKVNLDLQSASDLNLALINSKGYVLAHSIPVMDEIDIIHEVFFLLQGLPTTIFILGQDGALQVP